MVMGKFTDALLGRSDKQRQRIADAKARAAEQRQALRDRVRDDIAQTRDDWQETKAKAGRQSHGEEA